MRTSMSSRTSLEKLRSLLPAKTTRRSKAASDNEVRPMSTSSGGSGFYQYARGRLRQRLLRVKRVQFGVILLVSFC